MEQFDYVRNIGKGSYGTVTLARHKKDRKQYVVKEITLKKASARERRSAEQEAKLLSKLKHPNIVSYKDSFEKDGILYIAMQYCEGGDLYHRLKEQHGSLLDERQLVEWFVQIAMALQYMHERNILHRDLKTQNIFLTKSKIIKVGDLGIARVLDSSTDMATTLIGTPYYMSPELFSNKPYNHKSDVWALGCCVYEMATLKHAFNAKDMNSLVYKILKGKMPLMPKQYTSDLVQLIRNMLHQDPSKRPTVNRILRDPYIKKNIAVFLEETRQSRRPSTARSRPSSASSQRSDISRQPPSYPTPSPLPEPTPTPPPQVPVDDVDSGKGDTLVSVSDVQVGQQSEAELMPPPPVPVPRAIANHRRKPSDGARQDLHPIEEGKVIENKEKENLSSSGSSEGSHDTMVPKTVKEQPVPQKKTDGVTHKKKKKSVLSKYARPDTDRSDAGDSAPKPVDKPRPLPMPPKVEESQGLPQRSENSIRSQYKSAEDSKSSSTSSSKEDNRDENMLLGDETPRSLPNLSARERRRQKNPAASSYERPDSARIRLSQDRSHSQLSTKSERTKYQRSAVSKSHPVAKHRQVSIADSSSSSDEDTLKENQPVRNDKEKHSHRQASASDTGSSSSEDSTLKAQETWLDTNKEIMRETKEMNSFISALDTTLQMNKEDDKSDEELQEVKKSTEIPDETPRIPKSSSMPSVETLCNKDRLMARIQLLHTDVMKGIGYSILKEAYEILGRIEEDEVEPKLVALMGKDKFDIYAGKIWQLKFCEDMAKIGLPS